MIFVGRDARLRSAGAGMMAKYGVSATLRLLRSAGAGMMVV